MNQQNADQPAGQTALLVLVILIGLNLRPFLTAIGPLSGEIGRALSLGMDTLAWLTLLPLWLIGIGVLLTPSLRSLASATTLLGLALLLLGIGSAMRFDAQSGALLIASAALCGLGSALVQGVLPALIKQAFAHKVPLVMGIFSACMMGGGALGASLTPRLAASLDWSQALALWSLPVLLAPVWLGWKVRLPRAAAVAIPHGEQRLITLPRSWLLIVCFGIINSGYGIVVAWLAPAYMAQGWSPAQAGELVAWLALAQTASGLGLPLLAARSLDRRPWMGLAIIMQVAGFGGLWLAPPAAPILWCMLCGAGLGGSFSLIMVIALDHLPDPRRHPERPDAGLRLYAGRHRPLGGGAALSLCGRLCGRLAVATGRIAADEPAGSAPRPAPLPSRNEVTDHQRADHLGAPPNRLCGPKQHTGLRPVCWG